MSRVMINPRLLRWAIERSHLDGDALHRAFPRLEEWVSGNVAPTLKQLEVFAAKTHTPLGYLFLAEPPTESLPIKDFRRLANAQQQPSADLLDTIYAMQRRQSWLSEHLRDMGAERLSFVGSASVSDNPLSVGREMRRVIGLAHGWASEARTWVDAVGVLRRRIEEAGILAVVNGVVGNNTSRKLDVTEFRGFALVDDYAPLVFVNGADAKSAQLFTLAHEVAHLWLGAAGAGLSGYHGIVASDGEVERFCDIAAAEFLVPASEIKQRWSPGRHFEDHFETLARAFKVSPIVIGRRAMDLGLIDRSSFFTFYNDYVSQERKVVTTSGGDFYANQHARVGDTFARAVMRAALEGSISFREAYNLTDLNGGTFHDYGRRLGTSMP